MRMPVTGEGDGKKMETLTGLAISRGQVAGPVFLYKSSPVQQMSEGSARVAKDAAEELTRFQQSRDIARRQLETLIARLKSHCAAEAEIFENHLALVDDPLLVDAVTRLLKEKNMTAEQAVRTAMDEFRTVFSQMKDPYLRERARDVDDIERRILQALAAQDESPFEQIDHPVIIVADDLTPSETVSLPREYVLGFATDRGSLTSHVSLLARALGIPAVVGIGNVTGRVKQGEMVLLDGTDGTVTLSPDRTTRRAFEEIACCAHDPSGEWVKGLARRGALKDGTPVALLANVQPGVPLCSLTNFGAEGIGLYRSEYLWLGGNCEPSEDEQVAAYEAAARSMAALGPAARVTFRVLDLGGDKLMRGQVPVEANPFLGCRSLRWLLAHRDVFQAQLRAILRTSAQGPSAVMYPMVATVEELLEANAALEQAKASLRTQGIPFDEKIPRGCMIEVPSAALSADRLAKEVDFFSIGTNDLIQYTLAADRGNADVSYLYQPAHPAVIRLIERTVLAAREAGIPVSVCGESAADPVLGVLWVGLGVTSLSMGASDIPVLKDVLRHLTREDVTELADRVRRLCSEQTAAEIYAACHAFLMERVPGFGTR